MSAVRQGLLVLGGLRCLMRMVQDISQRTLPKVHNLIWLTPINNKEGKLFQLNFRL
ncbi:hypothetical protein [Tolypothrix sp. NIES-4075]|uniref:hypothetical protein n=1 Tax=Tolypothrix sp. NIES-4075 TaxID=2005459 RepID=UPI001F3EF5CB|nr:hypothetical protein [Tolypothrix sp. NIES-4075]